MNPMASGHSPTPSSPPTPSLESLTPKEKKFKGTLTFLSGPNKYRQYLLVEKTGNLTQTHIMRVLWEKFKGLFGGRDGTNTRAIQLKTLEWLSKKEKYIKSDDDYKLVTALAKRTGLIPANLENTPQNIQELITEISNKFLLSEEKTSEEKTVANLFDKFATHYEKELYPSFPNEVTNAHNVFQKIHNKSKEKNEEQSTSSDKENETAPEKQPPGDIVSNDTTNETNDLSKIVHDEIQTPSLENQPSGDIVSNDTTNETSDLSKIVHDDAQIPTHENQPPAPTLSNDKPMGIKSSRREEETVTKTSWRQRVFNVLPSNFLQDKTALAKTGLKVAIVGGGIILGGYLAYQYDAMGIAKTFTDMLVKNIAEALTTNHMMGANTTQEIIETATEIVIENVEDFLTSNSITGMNTMQEILPNVTHVIVENVEDFLTSNSITGTNTTQEIITNVTHVIVENVNNFLTTNYSTNTTPEILGNISDVVVENAGSFLKTGAELTKNAVLSHPMSKAPLSAHIVPLVIGGGVTIGSSIYKCAKIGLSHFRRQQPNDAQVPQKPRNEMDKDLNTNTHSAGKDRKKDAKNKIIVEKIIIPKDVKQEDKEKTYEDSSSHSNDEELNIVKGQIPKKSNDSIENDIQKPHEITADEIGLIEEQVLQNANNRSSEENITTDQQIPPHIELERMVLQKTLDEIEQDLSSISEPEWEDLLRILSELDKTHSDQNDDLLQPQEGKIISLVCKHIGSLKGSYEVLYPTLSFMGNKKIIPMLMQIINEEKDTTQEQNIELEPIPLQRTLDEIHEGLTEISNPEWEDLLRILSELDKTHSDQNDDLLQPQEGKIISLVSKHIGSLNGSYEVLYPTLSFMGSKKIIPKLMQIINEQKDKPVNPNIIAEQNTTQEQNIELEPILLQKTLDEIEQDLASISEPEWDDLLSILSELDKTHSDQNEDSLQPQERKIISSVCKHIRELSGSGEVLTSVQRLVGREEIILMLVQIINQQKTLNKINKIQEDLTAISDPKWEDLLRTLNELDKTLSDQNDDSLQPQEFEIIRLVNERINQLSYSEQVSEDMLRYIEDRELIPALVRVIIERILIEPQIKNDIIESILKLQNDLNQLNTEIEPESAMYTFDALNDSNIKDLKEIIKPLAQKWHKALFDPLAAIEENIAQYFNKKPLISQRLNFMLETLTQLNNAYIKGRAFLNISPGKISKQAKDFHNNIKKILNSITSDISILVNTSRDLTNEARQSCCPEEALRSFNSQLILQKDIDVSTIAKYEWEGNSITAFITLIQRDQKILEETLKPLDNIYENFKNTQEPTREGLLNVLEDLENAYPDNIDDLSLFVTTHLLNRIGKILKKINESILSSNFLTREEIDQALSPITSQIKQQKPKEKVNSFREIISVLEDLLIERNE